MLLPWQLLDIILWKLDEECQKARLVSFYYGSIEIDRKTKEKLSPTKLPELSRVPRTTVIDPRKFGKRIKGSGIPRYIYVLPPKEIRESF